MEKVQVKGSGQCVQATNSQSTGSVCSTLNCTTHMLMSCPMTLLCSLQHYSTALIVKHTTAQKEKAIFLLVPVVHGKYQTQL